MSDQNEGNLTNILGLNLAGLNPNLSSLFMNNSNQNAVNYPMYMRMNDLSNGKVQQQQPQQPQIPSNNVQMNRVNNQLPLGNNFGFNNSTASQINPNDLLSWTSALQYAQLLASSQIDPSFNTIDPNLAWGQSDQIWKSLQAMYSPNNLSMTQQQPAQQHQNITTNNTNLMMSLLIQQQQQQQQQQYSSSNQNLFGSLLADVAACGTFTNNNMHHNNNNNINNNNNQIINNLGASVGNNSTESFNDVLMKLGQGLNAAKKRDDIIPVANQTIPDLVRYSLLSSFSSSYQQQQQQQQFLQSTASNASNVYDIISTSNSINSNNNTSTLYSSNKSKDHHSKSSSSHIHKTNSHHQQYTKHHYSSRNSSPSSLVMTGKTSNSHKYSSTAIPGINSNQNYSGRGRGRPPKSNIGGRMSSSSSSGGCYNSSNFENDPTSLIHLDKASCPPTLLPQVETPLIKSSHNLSTSSTSCGQISSKLVIPPTLTAMSPIYSSSTQSSITTSNNKYNPYPTTNVAPNSSSAVNLQKSTSSIGQVYSKKNKERTTPKSLLVTSKKVTSPNSIDNTIDDVLKSFQSNFNNSNSIDLSVQPMRLGLAHQTESDNTNNEEEDEDADVDEEDKEIIDVVSSDVEVSSVVPTLSKKRTIKSQLAGVLPAKRMKTATATVTLPTLKEDSMLAKPLLLGWKRETYLKSIMQFQADVIYQTPNFIKIQSVLTLKEILQDSKYQYNRSLNLDNFSFDSSIKLGDYYQPSSKYELGYDKMCSDEVDTLFRTFIKTDDEMTIPHELLISQNNESHPSPMQSECLDNKKLQSNQNCNQKKQISNCHTSISITSSTSSNFNCLDNIKNLIKPEKEIFKHKKLEQKLIENYIAKELKKPIEDLRLMNTQELPRFDEIPGNRLPIQIFQDCLFVTEFLSSFSELLGIDAETIPTFHDYQMAFIDRNAEHLEIICHLVIELLKYAICDPGIPNLKMANAIAHYKLSESDLTLNTMSYVLSIFVQSRSSSSPSLSQSSSSSTAASASASLLDSSAQSIAQQYLDSEEIQFMDLVGQQQSTLLSFVVCEMINSRMISGEIDRILDQQAITRRDKWILDGRLRRMKAFHNHKIGLNNINGSSRDPEVDCNESSMQDVDSDMESVDSANEGSNTNNINSNNNAISSSSIAAILNTNYCGIGSNINWSAEDEDINLSTSLEDLEKRMDQLTTQIQQKKWQLINNDHKMRGIHLGQDRFHRRYYLLRYLGGIFVEPFNELEIKKSVPSVKPKKEVQLEPLDLTKESEITVECKEESVGEPVKIEAVDQEIKSTQIYPNNKIMEEVAEFYGSRAKFMYPDVELDQLKWYYQQHLEDYLKDYQLLNGFSGQGINSQNLDQLKVWLDFYKVVMKEDNNNLPQEPDQSPNPDLHFAQSLNYKSEQIKIQAEKELHKMSKQLPEQSVDNSTLNTIPQYARDNWRWIRSETQLKALMCALHRRGLRERQLYRSLERNYELICACFKQDYDSIFNYNGCKKSVKLKIRTKSRTNHHHHHQVKSNGGVTRNPSTNNTSDNINGSQDNNNNTTAHSNGNNSADANLYAEQIQILEKIEDLLETVVNASLYKKGWKYPERVAFDDTIKIIPCTHQKRYNYEMYPLDLAKERLLELEDQLERRYLLPPLNWEFRPELFSHSTNKSDQKPIKQSSEQTQQEQDEDKINQTEEDIDQYCSNLKKTLDEVVSTSCSSLYTSSTKDSTNKSELVKKSSVESKNEAAPGLINWRNLVLEASDAAQLEICIGQLNDCIAWDKSIMKVLCQICQKDCDEARLLLCDSCDRGYHTYCFRPAMSRIPDGAWYCFDCVSRATNQRLCCVCGNPKTTRTLVCNNCARVVHALCARPPVTRVPRKWLCHNCCGRRQITTPNIIIPTASSSSINNLPAPNLTADGDNSNSSHPTYSLTDPFGARKDSVSSIGSSSITSKNIISKKRKSTLSPTANVVMPINDKKIPGKALRKRNKRGKPSIKSSSGTSEVSPSGEDNSSHTKRPSTAASLTYEEETVMELTRDLNEYQYDSSVQQMIKNDFDLCRDFLQLILKQSMSHHFLQSVDVKKFPIYKKIIKTPMDFTSLKKKLLDSNYSSVDEFSKDLQLIFDNCEKFNEDDSEIGIAGHGLRSFYNENWPLLMNIKELK